MTKNETKDETLLQLNTGIADLEGANALGYKFFSTDNGIVASDKRREKGYVPAKTDKPNNGHKPKPKEPPAGMPPKKR